MESCPICHKPAKIIGSFGHPGEKELDGTFVSWKDKKYTVHLACLEEFEKRLRQGDFPPKEAKP